MSGRYGTVAAQAVGVAVIAAIVYFAFLRSEDPESLSGIKAEDGGGETIVESTQPGDSRNQRNGKSDGDRRGDQDRSDSGSGERADRADGGGGDTAFEDDFTPPGDQYDDLVTRLMMRVGEPSALGEIGPGG